MVWLGDTGAYFVGRSLGRHKLAPTLSPKKTVEGAVGGILGSVAGAWIIDLVFDVLDMLKGKRIFLHCAANARVSAFVYLYRMSRLGVDPADAKKDLYALWVPKGVWKDFVNESINRLGLQV